MNDALNQGSSAWIVTDADQNGAMLSHFAALQSDPSLFGGIKVDDWLVILDDANAIHRVGRVYRIRSTLTTTTYYFDKEHICDLPVELAGVGLTLPVSGNVSRIPWDDFTRVAASVIGASYDDIPLISEETYVRELMQIATLDDLLGPAGGPFEQIVDMGVQARYLVGKLSPMRPGSGTAGLGIEGGTAETAEEIEANTNPDDLHVHEGRHETGAEFGKSDGVVEAEADSSDEIDATNNQSLVPSSIGMTFCVDDDVKEITVKASWGRYERLKAEDHEHYHVKKDKKTGEEVQLGKARVWQRVPCGGEITLPLKSGVIVPQAPDASRPEVRVQGTVRDPAANGDRLITLFLVNAQDEPETNRDAAWVFQPEIAVMAAVESEKKEIFRRRPILSSEFEEERESLEMIYRKRIEFVVGHGISASAQPSADNFERAVSVQTTVVPQYEVGITETPGLDPADRPVMIKLVKDGLLDMQTLAGMSKDDLTDTLTILVDDYRDWIAEQRSRIGAEVVDYDARANDALDQCVEIETRLREGIAVLVHPTDDDALTAFRFANKAMALQRIHSLWALSNRRGGTEEIAAFDIPKNRTWRPFQLAFILLSIPSLADPTHNDRASPVDARADLLWFPTGGGKTEAYLGVATFAMGIRRLQGNLGGYDSSRGLSVIMRYTLRLLTLQQFQRASTLLCAMEVLRREALTEGDEIWGAEPFTIGLWVGNRVTPGTTEDAAKAIAEMRDKGRRSSGASPGQLTSCPWCGIEIKAERDIEVDKTRLRTTLYCGDKRSRCEFSRGKSAKLDWPGLPVTVVDEELYHRPPSMMIATVDKFAMMAWRGQVKNLFGYVSEECERHGLLWEGDDCCSGSHPKDNRNKLPSTKVKTVDRIRPPDLVIQDEFHLISGPLGTMVGLYETAVDDLSRWEIDGQKIRPKVVASTATVRKAEEQMNNVFMRRVAVFPPHGLDVDDNFFSIQRSIEEKPGRRYLGICAPGSSRPAMLIRIYTALQTTSQSLFERFGPAADPYLTTVGYFNSLRELGGMKRLADDDVRTRAYRVQMSLVQRPGLGQRSVNNVRELTSRVSNDEIPKYLDQLEVKFKHKFDATQNKYVTDWQEGDLRAIDIVLATNMLSVGVDVGRLGVMAVNGQPKSTAEYIQATSRVGRVFPGLVLTVLTWARPRDLSHYETYEHYHASFYKHVEAQSVTPFSPRALDRGLTGTMISALRLENRNLNPNDGAGELKKTNQVEVVDTLDRFVDRVDMVSTNATIKALAEAEGKARIDRWATEANVAGRTLSYEKRGQGRGAKVAMIESPGLKAWSWNTVPMSMREVEPGVRLVMNTHKSTQAGPSWIPRPAGDADEMDIEIETSESIIDDTFAMPSNTDGVMELEDLLDCAGRGGQVTVNLPGDGPGRFRLLNQSSDKPANKAYVILSHPDLNQRDAPEGMASGIWTMTEQQDADTNESLCIVTVRRPGANTTIKLDADEWEALMPLAVKVGDRNG